MKIKKICQRGDSVTFGGKIDIFILKPFNRNT